MIWYCYETVNKINGKYYRGKSGSEDPEHDGYLGSGPALKKAIAKYGKDKFTKSILATFNTEQEAYDYESQIVTLKEVQDPMCYNMQLGGLGGTQGVVYLHRGEEATRIEASLIEEYTNQGWKVGISEQARQNHIAGYNPVSAEKHRGYRHTEEAKRHHSEVLKGRPNLKNRGRALSEETRHKMSESHRGKPGRSVSEELKQQISNTLKERNKQHPRVRITKDGKEKAIERVELQKYLDMGWVLGRKPILDTSNMGKHMLGTHHSEETKAKMRAARLGKQGAIRGKTPVNNGTISKYIYPEELQLHLDKGWVRGRLFRQGRSIYTKES